MSKAVVPANRLTLRHKSTRSLVLLLFSRGLSQRGVAEQVGVTESAIRDYRTNHPEFDEQCRAGVEARLKRLRELAVDAVEVHLLAAAAGEVEPKPALISALFQKSEAKVVEVERRDVGEDTLKAMNRRIADTLARIREQQDT